MREYSLNGNWLLQSEKEFIYHSPQESTYDTSGWLSAQVPGTVQEAYITAGKLPHPFYEDNAKLWQELEDEVFWFRREFSIPVGFKKEKVTLDFEGLDTITTIYLNGKEIGKTSNAFVPFSFDVTKVLHYNAINVLAVKFDSAIQSVHKKLEEMREKGYTSLFGDPNIHRVLLRKPQVGFGWDFGVRLLSVGIWRNVTLRSHEVLTIENMFVKTVSIGKKSAEVELEVNIKKNNSKPISGVIQLSPGKPGTWLGKKMNIKFSSSEKSKSIKIPISVKNPKLWFPHNIGKPNLYQAKVDLKQGSKILDSRNQKFGIRIVKLIESEDGENRFTVNINGNNVFCKGANWVPGDAITMDSPAEKYQLFIEKAVDANMNMLRIWGGGIYENELFYNLCDEMGIMVWQDFLYSCGMYPDDDLEFMKNVEDESIKAITRLRNHPSIVLWCGNNENQVGWEEWGWNKMAPRHYGEKIYNELLPGLLNELDGTRPYHPGSPFGGSQSNGWKAGDNHDWRVWHAGIPYQSYEDNTSRFVSEYGMQAAPNLDTVKKYLGKSKQWPLNDLWVFHHLVPEKIANYLKEFGEAHNVEEFVTLTQLLQAHTYKFAIESFRRRKYHCSGSLFWQYNDPWPTMCWSVVDYYRKPKASYFWAKRAYQNILPVFKENKNGSMELWVINDTLKPINGKVEILFQDFEGNNTNKLNLKVSIPANSSQLIDGNILSKFKLKNKKNELIRCKLITEKIESENVFYFSPFREQELKPANLRVRKIEKGNEIQLVLNSDKLVRFVELSTGNGNLWFSDNYFDIYPGEPRIVKIRKDEDSLIRIKGYQQNGIII